MLKRILSAVLGAVSGANGVVMLAAGERWFAETPGVAATGPFNPHFVADVGAAYLVGGLALLARAWRPRLWPAAVAASAFFVAHALIHLIAIAGGHAGHAVFELAVVIAPAALSFWAAFPGKDEPHV
jgi:hypothetical protein